MLPTSLPSDSAPPAFGEDFCLYDYAQEHLSAEEFAVYRLFRASANIFRVAQVLRSPVATVETILGSAQAKMQEAEDWEHKIARESRVGVTICLGRRVRFADDPTLHAVFGRCERWQWRRRRGNLCSR